jgi:PEP-CTERM motif
MRLFGRLLPIAIVLAASTLANADTVLVGTDLTTRLGSSVLCPSDSNCEMLAQEFTLFSPVVIDQVKVGITGNGIDPVASGDFSLSLIHELGGPGGISIGSGSIAPSDNVTGMEIFDFSGLNISRGPGTYFLEMSGSTLDWAFSQPLMTTAGSLGQSWSCDPTVGNSCGVGEWNASSNFRTMEIDGTVVTPEPSTFALLATGILGLAGAARRKFLLHS